MSELHKLIQEAAADVKPGEHKCRYCGQGFVKETTLAASVHLVSGVCKG